MTDVDRLDTAIADLQTELNRIDRVDAARQGVGSMEDLQVLRLLHAQGPQRVGAIATMRAAGKATVSARIDRLEQKGLVSRDRIPGDRRGVVCALTPEGRTVATRSRKLRRRLLAAAPLGVEPGRLEELVGVLRASLAP
ncbi:MAG: MarR family transcriptional regulator [Acidimicrobiales bacterium]|nr:MarR family transcriptional regulator [Acidimicrobiales bacterium]